MGHKYKGSAYPRKSGRGGAALPSGWQHLKEKQNKGFLLRKETALWPDNYGAGKPMKI